MTRYKNVLIVWSNDTEARARDWNRTVSFAERSGARLRILQVASELETGWKGRIVSAFAPELPEAAMEKRSRELNRRLRTARTRGVEATGRVLAGANPGEILAEAASFGNDLIVVVGDTSRMRKLGAKLTSQSAVPVVVAKPQGRRKIASILTAINLADESPEAIAANREVLRNAIEIARQEGAVLDVVHAWQIPGETIMDSPRLDVPAEQIEDLGRKIRESRETRLRQLLGSFDLSGIRHRVHLVQGRPEAAVRLGEAGPVGRQPMIRLTAHHSISILWFY